MLERPQPAPGLDLVGVARFRDALSRHPRLAERLFTEAERAYCRTWSDPVPHLAARFAAKEAVGKALGTGVLSWQEIEVAAGSHQEVRLSGRTEALALSRGIGGVLVSLTHTDVLAGATALAWRTTEGGRQDGAEERK